MLNPFGWAVDRFLQLCFELEHDLKVVGCIQRGLLCLLECCVVGLLQGLLVSFRLVALVSSRINSGRVAADLLDLLVPVLDIRLRHLLLDDGLIDLELLGWDVLLDERSNDLLFCDQLRRVTSAGRRVRAVRIDLRRRHGNGQLSSFKADVKRHQLSVESDEPAVPVVSFLDRQDVFVLNRDTGVGLRTLDLCDLLRVGQRSGSDRQLLVRIGGGFVEALLPAEVVLVLQLDAVSLGLGCFA